MQLLQPHDKKKMTKFLPPGTVMDLFQQYSATRQLLQAPSVGYKTFLKVYKEKWSDVLKFRDQNLYPGHSKYSFSSFPSSMNSMGQPQNVKDPGLARDADKPRFSKCEICFQLQEQLKARDASLEVKLSATKALREHLHSQFSDRAAQWSLEEVARDGHSGTVVISVDGMDQGKFRIPRHPGQRALSSMTLSVW